METPEASPLGSMPLVAQPWISQEGLAAPASEPTHKEDADIRALIAEGELERALGMLMDRHGDALFRYCCKGLDSEAHADDVLQQVFIEAFRDLRAFTGRSTLRGWLFGIARHRVLDHKRVLKRNLPRSRPLRDTSIDPRPPAAELIDDARLREALVECLGELGDHVRNALLLRYQQGFSFEEMSAICEEKSGTLQARVARALPVLRKCIEARTGGAV